ncbi:hypothetical protein Tco_0037693 [Tanacetum coccineum]
MGKPIILVYIFALDVKDVLDATVRVSQNPIYKVMFVMKMEYEEQEVCYMVTDERGYEKRNPNSCWVLVLPDHIMLFIYVNIVRTLKVSAALYINAACLCQGMLLLLRVDIRYAWINGVYIFDLDVKDVLDATVRVSQNLIYKLNENLCSCRYHVYSDERGYEKRNPNSCWCCPSILYPVQGMVLHVVQGIVMIRCHDKLVQANF